MYVLRCVCGRSGGNHWCSMVFVFVYFSTIAALMWFVILSYAWYMTFKAYGKVKEALEKHSSVFHLAAWSVPLVLTVICITVAKVRLHDDGD